MNKGLPLRIWPVRQALGIIQIGVIIRGMDDGEAQYRVVDHSADDSGAHCRPCPQLLVLIHFSQTHPSDGKQWTSRLWYNKSRII